jgi:hypothetical protein
MLTLLGDKNLIPKSHWHNHLDKTSTRRLNVSKVISYDKFEKIVLKGTLA